MRVLDEHMPPAVAQEGEDFLAHRRFVTSPDGTRWWLDERENIDCWIARYGAWDVDELAAARRILRPGDTVLDVGAHIGGLAVPFAQLVGPEGRVYAFEPSAAAAVLSVHAAINGLSQLRVLPYAVLDVPQRAPVGVGMYSRGDGPSAYRRVPSDVVSLGAWYTRAPVPAPPALVKVDVDGYEPMVLKGAGALLVRHPCPLLLEVGESSWRRSWVSEREGKPYGWAVRRGLAPLLDRGFTLFHGSTLEEPCTLGELLKAHPLEDGTVNVLAMPPEAA